MVYSGTLPISSITSTLNNANFDLKHALRLNQQSVNEILSELGDPTKALIIDGKRFEGNDKFGPAATLTLNNKMEQLTNQTTSIVSVFSDLFKMEKQLSGLS